MFHELFPADTEWCLFRGTVTELSREDNQKLWLSFWKGLTKTVEYIKDRTPF
jgi:hypothetical protein